ncbi:MAG TPA: family 78 glycoside hydrolase catalytic domain [Tepidisphaeraceae bacterium]|jgi:alpha-L-rhamnosidase
MGLNAAIVCTLVGLLAISTSAGAEDAPVLKPADLRCEYHRDPLGIDATRPRLSWLLQSEKAEARNQSQSAYQILVASAKEKLQPGQADLWDTGKVLSDSTNQIAYNGQPLKTAQRCYWTVRTWNAAGAASQFSEPAMWTMGLLNPNDWQAQWIGFDENDPTDTGRIHGDPTVNLDNCKWIWIEALDATEKRKFKKEEKDEAYFRKTFEVARNKQIRAVTLMATADNSFELYVNGEKASSGNNLGQAFATFLTNQVKPGKNVVAAKVTNSGGPAGLVCRFRVDYTDGSGDIVQTDSSWTVNRQAPKDWKDVGADDAKWQKSVELVTVGEPPFGTPQRKELVLPPAPYLRKTFTADKAVKRATLYATALGLYDIHINGKKAGDLELSPGWTDFHKRVYYNTIDVTDLVKQGKNTIATALGDGWYEGYLGYHFKRRNYGGNARLRAQLVMEMDDGTTQTVITDPSWRASYGPLREADLLMGCTYDATRELPGWDTADFDDSKWQPVTADRHSILVQAHPGNPVKRIDQLPSKKVMEPRPGVYVFDLGQNMVGWCRYQLNVKPNQKLVFRYAEMLNPDGTPYTVALRAARATDTYIASKEGAVTWEPQFTFHGFRYVEITGLTEKPSLDTVTGVVVHSAIERTGEFSCSNEMVNQLFHNIIWGQKGNYLEVPTDCPQRDERLGWTGDANFFVRTASYNFNVAPFFTKWLVDLVQDSQMKNGGYTHVAPAMSYDDGGGTAWQDAAPICTWTMWQAYGDTRIIEQHYVSLQRYMEYLHDTAAARPPSTNPADKAKEAAKTEERFIRNDKPFGDWLNLQDGTKSEVIGTAYYAHVAEIMTEMARAIGRQEDATAYAELTKNIKNAFRKNFMNTDGSIKEASQTGYALAFTMGLIPKDLQEQAAKSFVQTIERKNWHLATGFIGTPRLLPALTDAGKPDVAYRLLLNEDFPSWLYQVKNGATTMWERWDGWRPDKGFQDPGMNSFNHYAFGSVGQWLYETCAGIEPAAPGYKKIRIAPHPGGKLEFAKASYKSINGEITSEWKKTDGATEYNIVIPPNTTATIALPASEAGKVQTDLTAKPQMEQGAAVFEVGSGTYRFNVTN